MNQRTMGSSCSWSLFVLPPFSPIFSLLLSPFFIIIYLFLSIFFPFISFYSFLFIFPSYLFLFSFDLLPFFSLTFSFSLFFIHANIFTSTKLCHTHMGIAKIATLFNFSGYNTGLRATIFPHHPTYLNFSISEQLKVLV